MYKKYLTIVVFVMTASLKSADTTIQNIDAHFDLLVHKTSTCGCCKKWVDHMEDNGFSVITEDHQSLAMIKDDLKIQPKFRSCHTGVSQEGYFFEGHIPSRYVLQFLSESNPDAIGLSVPGMPLGSPGMEVDNRFTPYDVLIHFQDGTSKVYAQVRK
tara:strand:- start:982 stop:1452 length:471 start_codon:yes stop_codon:yes gene_type:complete